MQKLRVDSYEAGLGVVGGLGTFHNNLYPRLAKRGYDVKTFSMDLTGSLPNREDYNGVIVRRPTSPVDEDTAYSWTYDVLHQMGIDVNYLTPSELRFISNYFQKFSCPRLPYRMSDVDIFSPNDWMSYIRSAEFAWIHPKMTQTIFLHSTEPGRRGGLLHINYNGTINGLNGEDIFVNKCDNKKGFFEGERLIRDLEFSLTFTILDRLENSILLTVSKIHRKEYLLGVKAHGMKLGKISDRVFSVYHGVDTKEFRPLNNVEKKDFTIGFIGRCSDVKGIDIIPKIANILKNKIPDLKFHIVTKTDKQDPYYFKLSKYVHDNGLEDIVFCDNTFYVNDEKIKLINSWNAVIVPSRYEPQGQVDLEAMSCGVPPLVGLGGLREKVIDGYDGIWINPNNVEETADKILQLHKSDYKGRKIEEIGQNARDSAEKVWDWEKRTDAHEELINYLFDGRIKNISSDLLDLLLPSINPKR